MAVLTPREIVVMFLGLGLLLGAARVLGEFAKSLRQPAVVGEIAAGVLLGPTFLGALVPGLSSFLFPPNGANSLVLHGLTTLSLVLFLLVAGIEVELSTVWRQGSGAIGIGIAGTAVPFLFAFAWAWFLPSSVGARPEQDPLVFALVLGAALSISALPVIAKTLMDLDLYRSDLGMLVIGAAILNNLIGWMVFSMALGMSQQESLSGLERFQDLGLALAFALFMLTLGRSLLHRALPWIQRRGGGAGGVLGFTLALALLCGAFTEWFGVHALFGSLLVGIALGDSVHLREHTRETIRQFVSSFFAPLFFASLGLQFHFLTHFDWPLTVLVFAIASTGKILGCRMGAWWAEIPSREAWAASFAMNARGAMEIVLALLALQFGVIGQELFVSLVIVALLTSILSGPLMRTALRQKPPPRFIRYLSRHAFLARLQAVDRWQAIRELAEVAAAAAGLAPEAVEAAVTARERILPTGLGNGVAVPHARMDGLARPLIALGLSPSGIDFDAPDGEAAHAIFLVLVPRQDDGAALLIFADITKKFHDGRTTQKLLQAADFGQVLSILNVSGDAVDTVSQEKPP